jgi:hypothetical protein
MGATPATMGRALGLMYVGGPTVAALTMLLPHSEQTNETGIWIIIAVAYAVVPILFGAYSRLPTWAFEVAIAFAATLVSLVVWFDGNVASEYAFFYLWPIPFAVVFFPPRRALAQLAYSAVAYGVVLALVSDRYPDSSEAGSAATYWLMAVSALITVGLVVRALVQRLADQSAQREELQINDSILQGLVVARIAQEQGREDEVEAALTETLEQARTIITDLLGEDVSPGMLRRDRPAGERE